MINLIEKFSLWLAVKPYRLCIFILLGYGLVGRIENN